MRRRMSNLTKDKLKIVITLTIIILGLAWLLSGLIHYLFAADTKLTEQEQINKAYTEQQIRQEIRYWQMWEYTENMTEEEYAKAFYGGE